MSRTTRLSRILAPMLFAAGFAVALGTATGARAQESATAAADTDQAAAPADQLKPRRERRRDRDAAAPSGAPPATATTDPAEAAETKLICKSTKLAGSRMARRVCGTEEQWAAASERTNAEAEEEFRQMRNRGGLTGGPSSGPASLNAPAMN